MKVRGYNKTENLIVKAQNPKPYLSDTWFSTVGKIQHSGLFRTIMKVRGYKKTEHPNCQRLKSNNVQQSRYIKFLHRYGNKLKAISATFCCSKIGIHNKGTSKKLASARVQAGPGIKSERSTAEEPRASITPLPVGAGGCRKCGVASVSLTPKDASSFWTKPHCRCI